jgi:hypothetical protein
MKGFVLVLVILICIGFCGNNWLCAAESGDILVTFKDVPVKSNGDDTGSGEGTWQCVEYVKRFYREAMGVNLDYSIGSARNYYLKYDDSYYSYIKNSGLIRYADNSTTNSPKAGDIIVFDNTNGIGHVAISRFSSDSAVDIVEQKGKIDGGIIVSDAGVWKINKNAKYQYSDDFKGWELLDKYL